MERDETLRVQVSLARNGKMVHDFLLTISNEEIFMKKR